MVGKSYEEETAEEVCREYDYLSSCRGTQESTWLDIARRFIPGHQEMFSTKGFKGQEGQKDMQYIMDSAPVVALGRLVSILESLIMPRNQTWHTLESSNPFINKNREVKRYFEDMTRILFNYRYAPTANFSPQNQSTLKSTSAYGTGVMFIDSLQGYSSKGLRYRNIHLAEVYLAENHQGIVDRAVRKYMLTARQAMDSWGNKLPDQIKEAAKNQPETKFAFLHRAKKKDSYNPEMLNYEGMPYSSHYVCLEGKMLLDEGGYTSFPYSTPRYERAEQSVYGRSPAQDALPGVKTLYDMKKTVLIQGQKAANPVLIGYDDGILSGFSPKPGALNPGGVDKSGRPLIHALPTGDHAISRDMIEDEKNQLKDLFLLSLFQILLDRPQATATEVMELVKEKGLFIAPAIGGLQAEHCGQTIDRELDVLRDLQENGQIQLPPMPGLLIEAQGEYQVRYNSPFSRSQRSEESAGFMRVLEVALNVAAQTGDHSVLDQFNLPVAMGELADIAGVPESWKNTPEQIQALQAARQQQQQVQTAIQAAPGVAALGKSKAIIDEKSPPKQ